MKTGGQFVVAKRTNSSTATIDRHIGRRLWERRRILRMTQQDLGNRLGISFQQVQKYERGTNRISAGQLHRLTGILRVPIDYFYAGLPLDEDDTSSIAQSADGTPIIEFATSPMGRALCSSILEIPNEKTRRLLIELIIAFTGSQMKPK